MFYTTISRTSLLTQLQDLATYNVWAITRLADWLRTKPAAILEAEVASSFPGIKATLLHIREVERNWLAHLRQTPALHAMQTSYEETLEDVLDTLTEQAASFRDYVESLTEEELQEECCCNLMFMGEICRPRFEIIQHCLNHSTYHRGQVVTIGHQVGLKDAPMTDYMFYVLRVKEPATCGRAAWSGKRREKAEEPVRNSFLAVNFFSK